jgi:hypothetical protein
MRQVAAVGVVLALAAIALFVFSVRGAVGTQTRAAAAQRYAFSEGQAQVVLEVVSRGGMTGWTKSYRLFGDGRLDMRVVRRDGELEDGRELYLGRGDMAELLANLVSTGVLECDTDALRGRFMASVGTVPEIVDAGLITLTVRLDRYVSAAGSEHEGFEHTVRYQDPVTNIELLERGSITPFPELEGLAALERSLRGYWKLAGERP